MELSTIKMMIQQKKNSSKKMRENLRKLYQENVRGWGRKRAQGRINEEGNVPRFYNPRIEKG